MPSVITNTNNAIVISHSNGTAGVVGAVGPVGTGGAPGQSFGNWAVGSGVPNPVSDLNAYVDENGTSVTLFSGSYYIDTQTGDVWEFTLYSSPQVTQGGSNINYGIWTLTGANYAGPAGSDSYKEDVHSWNKAGGATTNLNDDNPDKELMSVMYSGTLVTGAEPTAVEIAVYGRGLVEAGDIILELTLEDDAGTVYADYSITIGGQWRLEVDNQRILTFNIQAAFPALEKLLFLKANYYSTNDGGRDTGSLAITTLHIY